MISLRFREHLDGYVAEEFDSLIAQLRSTLSVSLNEDGSLKGIDTGLTSVAIGTIAAYGGTTAPAGWLLCSGDAVSRVTYKSLFEVIGTRYGAGDGSTTFHLPNIPASRLGFIDHTHTITSDGRHAHTVESHNHSLPGGTSTGFTEPDTDEQPAHNHGGVTGLASVSPSSTTVTFIILAGA